MSRSKSQVRRMSSASGTTDTSSDDTVQYLFDMFSDFQELEAGNELNIELNDILYLLVQAEKKLSQNPKKAVVSARSPINIIGDIHGSYTDLMKLIQKGGLPEDNKYLFLGDYVDRGSNSIEVICYLLCIWFLYPQNVILLRGNHEDMDVCATYGFLTECERRFPDCPELFQKFGKLFEYFPIACVIDDKVFCVHGGPSSIMDYSTLKTVQLPITPKQDGEHNERGIWEMLWNDPNDTMEGDWSRNLSRGLAFYFSKGVVDKFLKDNKFALIIRAHEVVREGRRWQFDQKLLTVFSSSNYGGMMGNRAAMLRLSDTSHLETLDDNSFCFVTPYNYVYK